MTTASLPVRASTPAITADRVQRLAYDGLEAMRIAETHIKALRDYCESEEFDDAGDRHNISIDVPWWEPTLSLVIRTLQEQCYGPPTLPDRVFKEMASIENIGYIGYKGYKNLPGTEAIVICLNIASHMLEESRQLSECDDFAESLMPAIFVVDTIKGWLDGMLTMADFDERINAILGKPINRWA